MKKKIFAAVTAAAVGLLSLPLISGCNAIDNYILKVDDDGNKYYVAGYRGFTSSLKGEYEIPEYYGEGDDRAPVKEIAEQGFASTNLTKITVPKTVTKIGTAAFAYNNYLSEVVFAGGIALEEIPHGAFGNCYALSRISIPDSVTGIGGLAFFNCKNLTSLDLTSIETIGVRAFDRCEGLGEVTLSSSLVTIGELAFYMSGLTSIDIPDSVHDIVKPALDEDGNQKKDEDGNLLTTTVSGIGVAAFYECRSLKKATVGEGVTVITNGAFGECTSLTELYLPAGLKEIKGAYFSEKDGMFIFGHAFLNVPLADLYYGGTEEEWTELKKNIDSGTVTQDGIKSDNSALFNPSLKLHFNA